MSKEKLLQINKILRSDVVFKDREVIFWTRRYDKLLKLASLKTRREVKIAMIKLDTSIQLTRRQVDNIKQELNDTEGFVPKLFDTRHLNTLLENSPSQRSDSKLQDIESVTKLFLSGMTIKSVAQKYQVAESTAAAWKKKLNIKIKRHNPSDDIIRLKKQGLTIAQIARELGFSSTTIVKRLGLLGLSVKKR